MAERECLRYPHETKVLFKGKQRLYVRRTWLKVGVIGTGAISGAYLGMAKNFPRVEIAACADLNLESAKAAAEKFGIGKACTVEELLKDDSLEIILNLTIPKAHVPVGIQILQAGKHTYAEKPLGINKEEGKELLAVAKKAKKRVGCAPDTFMGAGIQTARKLIDDGAIGRPVAFTAFMMGRGHESWHPESGSFITSRAAGRCLIWGPTT